MVITLNFEGLLRSPASWAKVNRKVLGALAERQDVRLGVQPRRGFLWDRDFGLPQSLTEAPEQFEDPDATLAFPFPPKIERVKEPGVPLVVHSLYEASRLPDEWVDPLRRVPDLILVPSDHVRRVYEREGIPETKLATVPYGYDPEVFHPAEADRESGDSLQLATVATPHFRKGLDLLRSVSDVTERDGLTWRVHSPFRAPENPDEFWVDPWVQEDLETMGFTVTEQSLGETELADVLRTADLCVQPSRSEGFGLVALEAMASGTPVVTTAWGGHLTFAGPGMIQIEGTTRRAGRSQYHRRHPEARVFEPDPMLLRSTIRRLLSNRTRLEELEKRARETVEGLTWERTAARTVDAIRANLSLGT